MMTRACRVGVVAVAVMLAATASACGTGSGAGSGAITLPSLSGTGGATVTLPSVSVTGPTPPPTGTATVPPVTSSPSTTAAGAPSSSSTSGWWIVALIAAIAAAGVGAWWMVRRRGAARDWSGRAQSVEVLAAALQDAVAATTMTLTQPLAPDRAMVIDRRINDLDIQLRGLQASAPDAETVERVSAAAAALTSLRTAIGLLVDAPPGAQLTRQVAVVDSRAADFDAAVKRIRTPG